jgi:hypothetical protein
MSSVSGMVTLPSVEAMITLLPEDDLPKSFEISTVIVNTLPVTFMSQFFMEKCSLVELSMVFY